MRISIVSETYFPQINGVSRALDRLVRHLVERGYRVQVIIPRYGGESPLPAGVEKVEWRSLPLPFYQEVRLLLATPGGIGECLEGFGPDLVHIATEGPLGWAALKAAGRLGLPVVSSYHTNFPEYVRSYGFGRAEPLAWNYLRRFHNATRATYCPSESVRSILEDRGFRNVSIWSRGVDSLRFNPQHRDHSLRRSYGIEPEECLVVYSGRLAPEKNLTMLLEAWQRIGGAGLCRLFMVGDGPQRQRLERLADRRTIFLGYRYGAELARIYASADLLVFPSITETFGNVVLEGMASGLPAVAYDVPGPRDIIRPGVTGKIVEEISADALGRCLGHLMQNREELRRMGRNARADAEGRSWSGIMEGLRENYQEILARGPRRETGLQHADQTAH